MPAANLNYASESWHATLSWRKLFTLIAPYLMENPVDGVVQSKMADAVADSVGAPGSARTINDQQFKTITIQFKALGLVTVDYLETTKGEMALFWQLTPRGERVMMEERIVKKSAK